MIDINEIIMTPNYSLFRSRTFWTLVFAFVFNGFTAIQGQIPAGVEVIVNGVLLIVASYFHLSTGNSVTGAN